ncbi:hypothetical protein [Denitromonas iodatirespirans]|uniref:Lipoprotein n=1 Tax=Denitromonas iodatirespirans TaxID=2795389 RepID=A0A944D933_DENI1|nr:hypothetical protein [Denitromonas iodatirespirans]MBT0962415.1 hypothetical protein [Denitromonas iodatirespirans]
MAMKLTTGLVVALLTAACASTSAPLDTAGLSAVFVKDFTSSEPTACTTADVDLTHSEAHAFFKRARQLDARTLSDNYPVAPCRIEGTLKAGKRLCDWQISAAATGVIRCDGAQWFFACDDCEDLFAPAASAPARKP